MNNHNLHIYEWIARFSVHIARRARLRNVEFIGESVKAELETWIQDNGGGAWKKNLPERAAEDSLEGWRA